MSIKLCILDFDGTLCDSEHVIISALRETLLLFNHTPISETLIANTVKQGISLEKTFSALSNQFTDNEETWITEYRRIYAQLAEQSAYLFDGVNTTLQTLSGFCPLVILSQKLDVVIHENLAKFQIGDYISLVVGARDNLEKKPSSDPYDKVIAKAFPDIAKEETIMVGDTPTDLLFANNVGIRSVFASYGSGDHTTCLALNPDHIIECFEELLLLFKKTPSPAASREILSGQRERL